MDSKIRNIINRNFKLDMKNMDTKGPVEVCDVNKKIIFANQTLNFEAPLNFEDIPHT